MAIGPQGPADAVARAATHDPASNREWLRLGHMAMLVAVDEESGANVTYGSLLFDGGPTPMAEIVAVGTVPSPRRRGHRPLPPSPGIAAALTAELAVEAYRRGVTTVWLSAADHDVAALYQRLGFDPVGTYLMATAP